MSVDEILARTPKHDLSGDRNVRILLKSDRRFVRIPVVEDDCNAGFGDTSLTALVNEILNETNGIENVGFTTAVEAGDRVERFVPNCLVSTLNHSQRILCQVQASAMT
jgi:hypothetical protein